MLDITTKRHMVDDEDASAAIRRNLFLRRICSHTTTARQFSINCNDGSMETERGYFITVGDAPLFAFRFDGPNWARVTHIPTGFLISAFQCPNTGRRRALVPIIASVVRDLLLTFPISWEHSDVPFLCRQVSSFLEDRDFSLSRTLETSVTKRM